MAVDFGKFSRSKADAAKLQQAASQVKNAKGSSSAGALPSKIKPTTAQSVFGDSANENAKVGSEKFIKNVSGVDDLKDLNELQKAQYDMLAAFADVDGDGKISQEEYNNLAALDGKDSEHFTKDDIDAIYTELGLATDASIDELMDAINKVFEEEESKKTSSTGKVEGKNVPAQHSGAKLNSDGQYELTVETYRGGKVQDDGNGGKRYPNGTMWGIVTNAYPDVPEDQKEQVYKYMAELNGWDEGWQNHTLHTGDNVKMPVLEYDDKGNVKGYKDKDQVEKQQGNSAEPKMVNNRGYEAEYEIKNEDGTTTRFTVPAGKEADISNAKGNVTTDGKNEDGNFQRTVENGNVKTEYTYSGSKMDGKPVTIKKTDADGNVTVEERTYDENGKIATVTIKDADGKEISSEDRTTAKADDTSSKESEENYQKRLDDINSTADLVEKTAVLNATLSGDYGLSTQEKADIINESLASFNGNAGDAQYYVKGDNADNLRTNINNVIKDLSDEEFMEFAQKFETSFGKSLTEFMDVKDNSATNIAYVNRLTDLYSNAGSDLSKVLEQFPITNSVQKLLKSDAETSAITNILTGTLDNVPESDSAKIDALASKVENNLSYLNDILDSKNYTDEEKAQVLKQLGAETITKYIRNKWSSSDQENYLTKLMGYIAGAAEA